MIKLVLLLSMSLFAVDSFSSAVKETGEDRELRLQLEQQQKQLHQKIKEMEDQEETEYEEKRKNLRNATYIGALLGFISGRTIVKWTTKALRPAISSINNRFFTGLELPVIFGALKVLATPLACLAIGGYVYYKIKNAIVEPYLEKHKAEWEKNKELFLNVKKEMNEDNKKANEINKKFMEKMQGDVIGLRTNMVEIQRQMDSDLEKVRKENADLKEKMAKAGLQTANDLGVLQGDLKHVGETNRDLKEKVSDAQKKIDEMHGSVLKMGENINRELRILGQQQKAITDLQAQMKNKKDKKDSKSWFSATGK
jgi:hypothetical protein